MKYTRSLRDTSLYNDANLVAYWTMDGNANDSKGSYNGSSTSVTYSAQPALFTQCAKFNGTSSYISYGDVLDMGTGNFTVSFWMKTSSLSGVVGLVGKASARALAGRWAIVIDTTNIVLLLEGTSSNVYNATYSFSSLTDNAWHHIVGTYDRAGNGVLYIDGVSKATVSISGANGQTLNSADPLYIGAYGNSSGTAPSYFYNGYIDDVAIFTRALSATEVASITYGETFPNNRQLADTRFFTDSGLVAYWKLDGNSNDSKGSSNGTDTSIAYGSQYGVFGQGANFNGTSSQIVTNFNPSTLGQNFTISAWIYPTAYGNYRGVAGNHTGANPSYGIVHCQYQDGYWYFGYGVGSSSFSNSAKTDKIPLNAWTHVVATYQCGTSVKAYVNGEMVNSSSETLSINHTTSFWIGKSYPASDRFFQGNMDDFAIFNRVLGASEVRELYEIQKMNTIYRPIAETRFINDNSMVAYWKLDGNSNDSKGSFNMTDASVVYVSDGFSQSALYNGVNSSSTVNNNLGITNGEITVCAWVKPNISTSSVMAAVFSHYDDTAKVDYRIAVDTDGIKAARHTPNVSWNVAGGSPLTLGAWHHVALTYSGTTLSFFMNGILKTTLTATGTGTGSYTTQTRIGSGTATATGAFGGVVEDVAVFNRALAKEEIEEIYQKRSVNEHFPLKYVPTGGLYATSLINDSSLAAYWRMNGSSQDWKGSYNGTDNAVAYGTQYGIFGQGAYYNGSSSYTTTTYTIQPATNSVLQSFVGWVKNDGTNSWYIFGSDAATTGQFHLCVYGTNTAVNFMESYYGGGGAPDAVNTVTMTVSAGWHHVALVKTAASKFDVYFDGRLTISQANRTATASSNFNMGRRYSGAYSIGSIEDIAVFNRSLTASEVYEIYSKGMSSDIRPLGSITQLVTDPSIISYWRLDSSTNDEKGANFGTPVAITYLPSINGTFGYSAVFNGTSSLIDCGNPNSFKSSTITTSAWIKTSGAGAGVKGVMVKQNAYGVFLQDNILKLFDWSASSFRPTTINLADGVWHHIAVTYQLGVTNGTRVYVDGTLRLITTVTVADQTQPLVIGNGGSVASATSQYYAGIIDDAAVFSRVLSPSEIYLMYTNGKTLVNWKFNGTATDHSGNGYHGTESGISYQYGLFDRCATFGGNSGSNVYVDGAAIDLYGTMNFTYGSWIRTSALPTGTASNWQDLMMIQETTNADTYDKGFRLYGDGAVALYGYDGVPKFAKSAAGAITVDSWHNLVGTYDGSTLKAYVNGALVATSQCSSTYNFTTPRLMIPHKSTDASAQYFSGSLEDVYLMNRCLSDGEVRRQFMQYYRMGSIFVPGIGDSLFSFSSATFSSPLTAGSYNTSASLETYSYGPTSSQCLSRYQSLASPLYALLNAGTYMKVPYNGYQWFVIPATANYTITAQGGTGGATSYSGRNGCKIIATFALTKGDILWIAVGQSGSSGNATSNDWCSAGGGGATFVALAPSTGGTTISNVSKCLICAAGGLGAREARFGAGQPAVSNSANGSVGTAFSSNFKGLSINGSYGGYGGYYGKGGFGGGSASDDDVGYAGGYDSLATASANSYVDSTGTSVTRYNEGDSMWPNSGYVTLTKV